MIKETQLPNVMGIVLASGFSRRMGEQKLLLPWKNKTILEHVIGTAKESFLTAVTVVIPEGDKERGEAVKKFDCIAVLNTHPETGMGHSLALAVKSILNQADAAVILLGDQPEIKKDDINNLYQLFVNRKANDRSGLIIQTKYKDQKIGHPILFSKEYFKELSTLSQDMGGKNIIQSHLHNIIYYQSSYHYPIDIDSPDEYENLLQRD